MIIINGQVYDGNSVSISGNKVIIDGKNCTPKDAKEINITVNGDIKKLSVDVCNTLKIKGKCGEVKTKSGDIDIVGDVTKNVSTMSGDVEIEGNVTGGVKTMSGDVDCKNIGGSVKTTSGDIKHRKR